MYTNFYVIVDSSVYLILGFYGYVSAIHNERKLTDASSILGAPMAQLKFESI